MGSTIIGANSLEQLRENLSAFDIELDQGTLNGARGSRRPPALPPARPAPM